MQVEKAIVQAPSLFSDSKRIYWTQFFGFEAIAQPDFKKEIAKILALDIPLRDKYNQIWALADQETVDALLFVDSQKAGVNRSLWEESKLTNIGDTFQALQNFNDNTDLLGRLPSLTLPIFLLVGLFDRNVGLDLVRDFHGALPTSRFAIFNRSAHFPDIEEPSQIIREVQQFLFEN